MSPVDTLTEVNNLINAYIILSKGDATNTWLERILGKTQIDGRPSADGYLKNVRSAPGLVEEVDRLYTDKGSDAAADLVLSKALLISQWVP